MQKLEEVEQHRDSGGHPEGLDGEVHLAGHHGGRRHPATLVELDAAVLGQATGRKDDTEPPCPEDPFGLG